MSDEGVARRSSKETLPFCPNHTSLRTLAAYGMRWQSCTAPRNIQGSNCCSDESSRISRESIAVAVFIVIKHPSRVSFVIEDEMKSLGKLETRLFYPCFGTRCSPAHVKHQRPYFAELAELCSHPGAMRVERTAYCVDCSIRVARV